MDLEWNLEFLCTFQDWPKESIVQIPTPGMPVDVSSFETMFINHALKLIGSDIKRSGR